MLLMIVPTTFAKNYKDANVSNDIYNEKEEEEQGEQKEETGKRLLY